MTRPSKLEQAASRREEIIAEAQGKKKRNHKKNCLGCLGCGGIVTVLLIIGAIAGGSSGPDETTTATSPSATVSATATPIASPSQSETPTAEPATEEPTPETVPLEEEQDIQAIPGLVTADGPEAQAAWELLDTIEVKGRAPKTGYDRALFGQAWADTDLNGCDTRNDILRRDLTSITVKPGTNGCKVITGVLADPYTGKTINFQQGQDTSKAVQIDHIVALSDAWQTGAQQMDASKRQLFANDPENLLAVDGPANQQKGDGDAATWLPSNTSYRCTYVGKQIQVKAKYGLWVKQAEKDAMRRVLSDCGAAAPAPVVEEPAPAAPVAPAPVEQAPVEQAPAQQAPAEPAPAAVYYKNCAAAREAGAAPIYAGQPGYGYHLDKDKDGVACEK